MIQRLVILFFLIQISGCVVSPSYTSKPIFFVEFSEGSSKLNNVFVIRDKLNSLGFGSGRTPSIVLVANGTNEVEYNVALERMYEISKLVDKDVRIFVRDKYVQDRNNLVAVHAIFRWDDKTRKEFEEAEYSDLSQMNSIVGGDFKRSYYRMVKSREIHTSSKTTRDQLIEIGKKLGWKMDLAEMNFGKEKYSFSSLTVNTLSSSGANSLEMKVIVKNIIETWFPENGFDVDVRTKTVTIVGEHNVE
ncbi:hypothetical protein KW507_15880 [Vibrio fluvialis]|nr:hypothetical protein [Vibrio fluvialis]